MTANSTADRPDSLPSARIRGWWNEVFAALAPLWVGGVALLCLVPGYFLAPALAALSPRAGVWVQYLALGTLFPVAVAAIVFLERAGQRLPDLVRFILGIIPIVAVTLVAGPGHSALAIALALLQTGICLTITSRHSGVTVAQALSILVTAFIAWAAVLEVLTWKILADVMPASLPLLVVVAIALVASCWWAFGGQRSSNAIRKPLENAVGAVCVVVLLLLAFRTDGLFTTDRLGEDGTFYHWGAMVGPAEAVRQGGWLLWDAPAPYGFLSTLALAAFPASTAWQSLYLLNAVASALLAIWLFFTIRAVQPGIPGSMLALAASAASVFLLPVWPPDLMPEHYFPMAGAFRFGWSYVLVGLLFLERRFAPDSREQCAVLAAGCICWLLSVLWSAESAFIGSAVWIPAFVLIVLRDASILANERDGKGALAWLLAPPLLLAGTLGAIILVYRRALGHGPDVIAFVEPVLTFSGTTVSAVTGLFEGLGPNRTIAVLVFAFLMLAMAAAYGGNWSESRRNLPVLIGLALGLWALASYAVGLPVAYAIFRFLPYTLLALALVLVIFTPLLRKPIVPAWLDMIRAGTIPILVAVLATVYSNLAAFPYYVDAIRNEGFHGGDVAAGLPFVDPSLEHLMQQAGVAATDPIYYAGGVYGDMMPRWTPDGADTPVVVSRQWLAGPLSAMALSPDERKQAMIERGGERQHHGGWLIERQQKDSLVYAIDAWFFSQLHESYVPAKIAANGEWQLVWYEPRDNWRVSFGERLPRAGAPILARNLLVNGKPLAESVLPAIWGYFGPEWSLSQGRKPWRCADGRGDVSLFVPSSRQAELAFAISQGAGSVRVTVNDGPAAVAEERRGNRVVAPLVLEAGWNSVAIDVADSSPLSPVAAKTADHCRTAGEGNWSLQIHMVDLRFDEEQIPR